MAAVGRAVPGILVVVGDEVVRILIRELLEMHGHTATEQQDGDRAVEILRGSVQPLVVVAGLHMGWPKPNPLLAALTADGSLASRHSFIWLYASTLDDAERLIAPIAPNRGRFVEMPFHPEELVELVAEAATNLPVW